MKKTLAILLAMLALFTYTAFAEDALIEKTVYEGRGIVDVDFLRKVQYDKLEIIVTDAEGNAYAASVLDRDKDDLEFRVSNLVPGREYSFTISGISAGTVFGSFAVPGDEALAVKKVEYDREDREIDVEFFSPVDLQGADMTLTDANGRVYEYKVRELEKDGFEAYVPSLEWGETYTIEITGVNGSEGFVPFTFVAVDD